MVLIHTKSLKQNLNTKSSSEAELVGLSDYVPYTLWMNNLLPLQGYRITTKKSIKKTKVQSEWKSMDATLAPGMQIFLCQR